MKEQKVAHGNISVYSGNTRNGEFPDQFQLHTPLIYSTQGYGLAMTYIALSDINDLIDTLTEWRDTVDHEQAAESGDMNVAVS